MKIGFAASILTAGFLLLPAGTVLPCASADGAKEEAAVDAATTEQDDKAGVIVPVCDPVPAPSDFALPALGGGALLLVTLGGNSQSSTSTISTR
mgnify:CR=1 FL=1